LFSSIFYNFKISHVHYITVSCNNWAAGGESRRRQKPLMAHAGIKRLMHRHSDTHSKRGWRSARVTTE
jgi:hypothetical protein